MTRQRRLLRLLKRAGLALCVAVGVVVLALVVLTQTAPGRALLVRVALPRVDAAIPGRLELRELARFGPSGVELRGLRIYDPIGDEVLRLESLRAEISLGELMGGRIVVPEVELRTGAVDLRRVAEKRRGLVAAFVDPGAPPSPPSTAPPPYVRVDRLVVGALDVRAPEVGAVGQLDATSIALDAAYELDRTSAATLSRFSARIERGGKPLGSVDELGAKLERHRVPSHVKLKLSVLRKVELELAARLVVPPEPSWKTEPISATLSLEGLDAAVLAELLRNPELEDTLSGSVSAKLAAEGTLERLKGDLTLETAGGRLSLTANVDDLERVRASLRCRDFALDRVRSDLPAGRLTVALDARADTKDSARIPVHVELSDSQIDGTALPKLKLATTVTRTAAENIDLSIVDGASRIDARGKLEFAGAVDTNVALAIERTTIEKWSRFAGLGTDARGDVRATFALKLDPARKVDANGDVSVARVKVKDLEVDDVKASFRLSGEPTRPVGEIDLRLERAVVAGQALSKLALRARGGPSHYRLGLDAELSDATVALDASVERRDRSVGLKAEARGTLKKQPWKVVIEPTTVTFDGGVDTQGIELELSGQELEARGRFGKRGGTLDFAAKSLDLATLSKLLALEEPARGSVALAGRLSGTPAVPNLEVTLRGEGISLGERPPVDVELAVKFDAGGGEASTRLAVLAEASARGASPLELELDAVHRFQPGPGFQRALADGKLLASLDVRRLDSEFVGEWAKLEALPAKGTLRGSVRAEGTQSDPRVTASLEADAVVLGAPLRTKTALTYEKGDGRLELRVDDERGRWLDAAAALDLAGGTPSLEALARRLPRAASDETWSFALVAGERKLSELPGLRDAAVPAIGGASLVLEHAKGAEPTGRFRVSARPSRELDARAETRCRPSRTNLELTGELGEGRVKTVITALDRHKTLLETTLEAEVALAPALEGKAPVLGRIHGDLLAERLELATLPLVCGAARGTLTAKARVHDPLGARPELTANVSLSKFSFGGDETIDAELRAEVTHVLAKAEASLVAQGVRSTLDAELPVEVQNGRAAVASNAPITLDVRLRRLPIAPFLNPRGKISYATGHIDGSVRARGRLRDPDVKGSLVLRDVAFTATDLAQPLHDIRGTFAFTRNELVIENFEAHDRDGVLRVNGGARLADAKRVNVALDIRAEEFPIRQQGQVVATTELEAKVKAKLTPERSEVTIDLGAVDMWIESLDTRSGIALESHPDFVVDGQVVKKPEAVDEPSPPASRAAKREEVAEKRAPSKLSDENAKSDENPETLLTLNAADRVWIKRDDFAVKLTAALTTRIDGDAARVEGRVSLLRGYLTLMGKDFEIQKGSTLLFIGGKTPNPVLDITAHHLNRRSGESVAVVISGRADKPVLVFTVDDKEVSAGQAFQAIYGSQQSNQDPKGADSQAKAFVGGLTAGLLATTARRELGAAAPIIMIEPGSSTQSGRVRAGFEFDSLVPSFLKEVVTGVYFEGIIGKEETGSEAQQRDARTQAGFLLEFYFPRNFFTSGQYGPGPTWSMDVGWQL